MVTVVLSFRLCLNDGPLNILREKVDSANCLNADLMLVDVWVPDYLVELLLCNLHDLTYFIRASLKVLNRECIECTDFHSGLPEDSQHFHYLLSALVVSKPRDFKAMLPRIPAIPVKDYANVAWSLVFVQLPMEDIFV